MSNISDDLMMFLGEIKTEITTIKDKLSKQDEILETLVRNEEKLTHIIKEHNDVKKALEDLESEVDKDINELKKKVADNDKVVSILKYFVFLLIPMGVTLLTFYIKFKQGW